MSPLCWLWYVRRILKFLIYLVIIHIQIVRCRENCYKRRKTSCETLPIHPIAEMKNFFNNYEIKRNVVQHTQHLELREHEWSIANCYFARNHNTLDSYKSTNIHERYYVNKNRCFSHCQSPPEGRSTRDRTWVHMLVAPWNDQAFLCHPSPESLERDHHVHIKIADSLVQLMANNRKHPCTHRKHALNI